jgi:hypothetical protein
MVVSRKQMTPKPSKSGQAGGSRKRFSSCGSNTATRKTDQAGGSRKTKSNGSSDTMHEVCVACHREGRKDKVRIDGVRKETFKGKGTTKRARLVGKCEHGHKWYRITKA